jgi:hypothetical protein
VLSVKENKYSYAVNINVISKVISIDFAASAQIPRDGNGIPVSQPSINKKN